MSGGKMMWEVGELNEKGRKMRGVRFGWKWWVESGGAMEIG
jgi:hypothetical protein